MMIEAATSEIEKPEIESVKAIYRYLEEKFIKGGATDQEKQQIKHRFFHRPCLWDKATAKFWKPKHAFFEPVSFFGNRRVSIPTSHPYWEVYQLLGQNHSPLVQDYLCFLQELATEYKDLPLNEEDKASLIRVFNRLEAQLSLEGGSIKNIPILTANDGLYLANKIFIPDASWRKDYIDSSLILHPRVSAKLAKNAGALSLIKDVIEKPVDVTKGISIAQDEWCQTWQKAINSPEFQTGLKRLIFHESDSEPIIDMMWLKTVKVSPCRQIKVDLFWKDETKIASAIPGTYYFDEFSRIFHIISSKSKFIMLSYLAESLNNQLGEYAVQNLLPLASIIDAEPQNINNLLNELRIRVLLDDGEKSSEELTQKSDIIDHDEVIRLFVERVERESAQWNYP
ncbi:hypothetical protein [Kamptonema sp. UHCC 0994]|uniref:hypothetical protein n=1 Tax=Kamptonema sp. UHCC 0994 TaxID=3031329 RepID=UPI0023B95627|nr:hypothetical protein [Kamptonema sp. UHCC 0994]MDF0553698.1 hypothetical protein [Kamptonema sp. UHCC 0994]